MTVFGRKKEDCANEWNITQHVYEGWWFHKQTLKAIIYIMFITYLNDRDAIFMQMPLSYNEPIKKPN